MGGGQHLWTPAPDTLRRSKAPGRFGPTSTGQVTVRIGRQADPGGRPRDDALRATADAPNTVGAARRPRDGRNLETTPLTTRIDGRAPNAAAARVTQRPNVLDFAEGSCMVEFGKTRVLLRGQRRRPPAAVPARHPERLGDGRVLRCCRARPTRAASAKSSEGRPGGRTQEIQRLIGRSLRGVVNLEMLGPRTITIDCDVLQADGGTRTASITGGYVALQLALEHADQGWRRSRRRPCSVAGRGGLRRHRQGRADAGPLLRRGLDRRGRLQRRDDRARTSSSKSRARPKASRSAAPGWTT